MMATSSAEPLKDENGHGGTASTPCPFHGCKRAYTDVGALESHIKDHEVPAESLPGKVLLCSAGSCSGSFPDMQKLMEHTRHHHKPNIFFLCESCRTKLRSYRGLLTHLHTCSKVPRGKTKSAEPAAAPNPNVTRTVMEQDPPHLDSQLTSQVPNSDGSFPAAFNYPESAAPPVLGPPFLSHSVASASQQFTDTAANVPPTLKLDGPAAVSDTPESQDLIQTQSTSPEPVHPAPGSAPHSPTGSSAVWKRNQGMTHKRRILWEHTKGRYMCVQCGQTATNRKEMTQHINSYHSGNKPAEDTGSSAANT